MKKRSRALPALASLCVASIAQAQVEAPAAATILPAAPASPASPGGALVLPKDTAVRLMVLNEVNSSKAKIGDRFVLRVDQNVAVGGVTIIPVGAKAWGEVTLVKQNGALGKAGRIGARLLYIEVGAVRIPITGEEQSRGNAGGDRVALAVAGFGPFGLFARGTQGKLKAGAIFNGYLSNALFYDPSTSSIVVSDPASSAK